MKLKALDHINIVTRDLETSARFYKDLLGLDIRNAPPPLTPEFALWLYDDNGRPVIHLNHDDMAKTVERDLSADKTGSIHHVAFECEGFDEICAKLKAQGTAFHINEISSIGLTQLFIEDPNNVLLELNFRAG